MKTLKEKYEVGQLIIKEEIDSAQLKQAIKILDLIDAAIPEGSNQFKAAAAKARTELQNSLSGGVLQKAKELVTNPLQNSLILSTCIVQGLTAAPDILKLYMGPDAQKSDETIAVLVSDAGKQKKLINTMIKSFEPSKALANNPLAKIGLTKVPYVANLNQAVLEIVTNSSFKQVEEASKKAITAAGETKKASPAAASSNEPQSGTAKTGESSKSSKTSTTGNTKQSDTSTKTNQTTGNAQDQDGQQGDLPQAEKIKRISTTAGVNKNAFNSEELSKMSNSQIKANFDAIAKSLGINLKS